jgi:hypothetical protein
MYFKFYEFEIFDLIHSYSECFVGPFPDMYLYFQLGVINQSFSHTETKLRTKSPNFDVRTMPMYVYL